jgi:cyclopropane-fatty-acyl-phospholipid synthase
VRIFVANRAALEAMDGGPPASARSLLRLAHRLHHNTPGQSRRNIHAHYDSATSFTGCSLDTMMYSAAVYPREDSTLAGSGRLQLDLICQRLHLGPQDHLLEIGTGWGGLAARPRDITAVA